jgi:hypothetical protein
MGNVVGSVVGWVEDCSQGTKRLVTTLHCIKLHCITLHTTTLHFTALHTTATVCVCVCRSQAQSLRDRQTPLLPRRRTRLAILISIKYSSLTHTRTTLHFTHAHALHTTLHYTTHSLHTCASSSDCLRLFHSYILHYTTLPYITHIPHYTYTTLHSISLHYTPVLPPVTVCGS